MWIHSPAHLFIHSLTHMGTYYVQDGCWEEIQDRLTGSQHFQGLGIPPVTGGSPLAESAHSRMSGLC